MAAAAPRLRRALALAVVRETPLNVGLSRCLHKVLLGEAISAEDVRRVDAQFAEHRVNMILREEGVAAVEELLCDELYL